MKAMKAMKATKAMKTMKVKKAWRMTMKTMKAKKAWRMKAMKAMKVKKTWMILFANFLKIGIKMIMCFMFPNGPIGCFCAAVSRSIAFVTYLLSSQYVSMYLEY